MRRAIRFVTIVSLFTTLVPFAPFAFAADPPQDSLRITFVGDIMLDGEPGRQLAAGVDPFKFVAAELADADLTIGNLECVIATGGTPFEKGYNFRAHPHTIPILARHFDALGVANNHAGDFGPAAFVEQCELLERAALPYFGGGRNRLAAHRPLIFERRGLRIALLAYNEYPPDEFAASETQAGVAWSVDERVLDDIRRARAEHRADIVIPFMHWGQEFMPAPNERQQTLARKMIDGGADAVIGGHPHVTQGSETYRGKPIVYSLGNFVFDEFEEGTTRIGWAVTLVVNKRGFVSCSKRVAHIDEHGLPHWVAEAQ